MSSPQSNIRKDGPYYDFLQFIYLNDNNVGANFLESDPFNFIYYSTPSRSFSPSGRF